MVDELRCEQESDCESELGEPMACLSIGVPAQLTEI
jgi:hypothetical protein